MENTQETDFYGLLSLDRALAAMADKMKPHAAAEISRRAAANTSKAIVAELKKLDFLRSLGAAGWDLSEINPTRLKFLAQLGRRATSQALQRAWRYPILAGFLRQSVEEITDEVVDLYDRCLAQSYARASRDLDEFRLAISKAAKEKVLLFRDIGYLVLDPSVSDGQLRQTIYQHASLWTLAGNKRPIIGTIQAKHWGSH